MILGTQELIASHESHLRYRNRRPGTIEQRRRCLWRLATFAGLPLLEIPEATLLAFVTQEQLGNEARSAYTSHVIGFYRWAVEEELIERSPAIRLRRPSRPRRLPRPMSEERFQLALSRAHSPILDWLYLAAYAGLRSCEIAQLRGEDFLLKRSPKTLVIREAKGGHMQSVPIAKALLPTAQRLAAKKVGWCFPARQRGGTNVVELGRPITASQLSKQANRFLHDNGISDTLHSLRHRFGTNVYQATDRDLRTTQELMRHQSPVSTAIYTYVDLGEAARALDRLI